MRAPVLVFPRTKPSSQGLGYLDAGAAGSPEAFGLGIAKGASSLGSGLVDFAAEIQHRNDKVNQFKFLTDYTEFETKSFVLNEELQRQAPATVTDFPETASKHHDKLAAEFAANIKDPTLQAQFQAKYADLKGRFTAENYKFQFMQQDAAFKTGLKDSANTWINRVSADKSLLDQGRQAMTEQINATALRPDEKIELAHDFGVALEAAAMGKDYKNVYSQGSKTGPPPNYGEGARSIVSKLVERSPTAVGVILSREQAAVVAGNMQQESGFRTWAHNAKEGAHGLIQWRLKRWDKMQASAQAAGKDWRDPNFQVDFFLKEFKEDYPEAFAKFISATTMEDMNAAMKEYIAYGDNSQGTRLENAKAILGGADPTANIAARDDNFAADIESVNSNPTYARVPLDQRQSMMNAAESNARQEANDITKAATDAINSKINALYVGLNDRTMDATNIQQGRDEGWLSEYDDIHKAETILGKTNKDAAGAALIQSMLDSNPNLYDNSSNNKELNSYYKETGGKEAIAGRNDAYMNSITLPSVEKLHDVPSDMVGQLSTMARSTNAIDATWALDQLAKINQASPLAYIARVDENLRKKVDMWTGLKDYKDRTELLASIRGGEDTQQRKAKEALKEEARDILRKDEGDTTHVHTLVNNIISSYPQPEWFTENPALSSVSWAAQGMEADFQELFIEGYAEFGNEEGATNWATKQLQTRWGLTSVGGNPIIMKYPPQLAGYKMVDNSYDWMDKQARAMLPIPADATFQLLSDEQTRQDIIRQTQGGPAPSYMVAIYKDGRWETMDAPPPDMGALRMTGVRRVWPARISFDQKAAVPKEVLPGEFSNEPPPMTGIRGATMGGVP